MINNANNVYKIRVSLLKRDLVNVVRLDIQQILIMNVIYIKQYHIVFNSKMVYVNIVHKIWYYLKMIKYVANEEVQ